MQNREVNNEKVSMGISRRDALCALAAAAAGTLAGGARGTTEAPGSHALHVRFLGTGAADWNGPDARGEHRRLSSILMENAVLIDYTRTAKDMLPANARPHTIFYTHSHGDHFDPDAALALGSVKRVYAHASWAKGLREDFAAAAAKRGCACPQLTTLEFGETATVAGLRVTSLPANHATSRAGEHCSMYLVEKGAARLLYATDTAGIPAEAAVLAGIDAHRRPGKPITALIMEATMGLGHEDDFRLYTHSSVATVAQTVRVLTKTGRYRPAAGQRVWLTHLARTLHGAQAELERAFPAPLAPAFDGLEITLRA